MLRAVRERVLCACVESREGESDVLRAVSITVLRAVSIRVLREGSYGAVSAERRKR